MLQVSPEQIEKFRQIKTLFYDKTRFPIADNWRDWSDDDVWWHLVAQVIAVGNSLPAEKFEKDASSQAKIAYQKLANTPETYQAIIINRVLRDVGTRYASSTLSKCRKTSALVHNLRVMKSHGGPKNFIKNVSELQGEGRDQIRIGYLMDNLQFLKDKSARDFLMELGLLTNAIAFDIRVIKVLNQAGIVTPKNFESKHSSYNEAERDVLTYICKPCGISGIELDRILYQHKDEIIKFLT